MECVWLTRYFQWLACATFKSSPVSSHQDSFYATGTDFYYFCGGGVFDIWLRVCADDFFLRLF